MTTVDLSKVRWEKSSYSGGEGGNCVEYAKTLAPTGLLPVRDSKDPDGPALIFSTSAWQSFADAVKRGEFPAS